MVDCSRRQQVLKQLNSQLQSRKAGILDLGVTGSQVPLLDLNKSVHDLKPSKIPRPSAPSLPLPPPGYVSETITAHRSIPSLTPTPHPTGRGQRQLTVVFHGLPQSNKREPERSNVHDKKAARLTSTYPRPAGVKAVTKDVAYRSKVIAKADKDGPRVNKPEENRKKRLAKLKARYLVRKFGLVWIRKVFGRVRPSVAKKCRAHFLVRRVFRAWSVEWWAARREWKLNIRAECHDRYRLWQLVWSAWTRYTAVSRERRRLKEMADCFSSRRVTRLVWSGWCEYVGVRRREGEARRHAEQWRDARLVRWVWLRWRGGVESVRRRRSMETMALHHWAHRLTEQVWHHWLTRLHTRQVLRLREKVAQRHYNQALLVNTWAGWQDYMQARRNKRALKGLADKVYCSKLLLRTLEGWRERFERVKEIAQFQELIVERGRVTSKRRAFQHWRFYISLCWYKSHLSGLSIQFRHFSLRRRAFRGLRLYSLWQQREQVNKQLACQHRTHKLSYRCWRVWLRRCEHREEIKMGPQTRTAQAHYARITSRKVMAIWIQYILHRRERKRLYCLADEQFKTYALPGCFSALRQNVEVKLYKRELGAKAEDFRRETLLSMVFYQWWRGSRLRQDLRMLERVAILHDEEVKKRGLLKFWRARTRERVSHLAQEATADTHYRHWKMGVAFQKWHTRLDELTAGKQLLYQACCHHDNRLTTVVLSAWKRYIAKRRCSREKRKYADDHFRRVIIHKLVLAWKRYHSLCRDKRAKRHSAVTLHHKVLKHRVLKSWIKFTSNSKRNRQLLRVATEHHSTAILRKCLWLWLQRTGESVEARQRETELVTECTCLLEKAKLSRILYQWRDFSVRSLAVRLATEKAEAHHATVLKRKCFTVWWEWQRRGLRKALLTRQGAWFMRNRLLSACYSQWRVQFMHALVIKQKSVTALWHWSHSLQRHCLTAWLLHTLERRRKRERYSQALDRHRKRLVTIGVTQWIKVATEMQAQREAVALQHQTKNTQAVLQCVRRCASHWLTITRKRRLHPFHHAHPTPVECPSRTRVEQHRPHAYKLNDGGCGLESQAAGEWSSVLKDLQLPDGSRKERPQPRRSCFLSPLYTAHPPHSHTIHLPHLHNAHPHAEAQPRQSLLPAPHHQTQPPQHSSFTFLTSTCSEPSQLEASDDSGGTYTVESPLLQDRSGEKVLPEAPRLSELAENQVAVCGQLGVNSITPTSGLHEDSVKPKRARLPPTVRGPNIQQERPPLLTNPSAQQESPPESSNPSIQQKLPPTLTGPDIRQELPPTLTDPSVQQELVQMRDILKHFHQLKARKKMLTSSLSTLNEQGNSAELQKVRQQLTSLSHTISSNEPLIRRCALRLNQLLAQTDHR